jgi:hypothetical protein
MTSLALLAFWLIVIGIAAVALKASPIDQPYRTWVLCIFAVIAVILVFRAFGLPTGLR